MTLTGRLALVPVLGSVVVIAAGYGSAFLPGGAPPWAGGVVALGTSTLLVAMMILGARRRDGSLGGLLVPFVAVYLILVGSFGLALLLPAEKADSPRLVLGLPLRAALVLYGIGLLPAAILPLAYALTFDRLTLRPEDLARIREARARREAQAGREASS